MDFEEWYSKNGYYHDTVTDRKHLMQAAWSAAQPQWLPIDTAPKDGSYCRFHYDFGQEEILKWSKARQYWVNFEMDVDYDAGNDGLGNPTHWTPYTPPTQPATHIEDEETK